MVVQHAQEQAVLDQERMDLKSQQEAVAANEGTEFASYQDTLSTCHTACD